MSENVQIALVVVVGLVIVVCVVVAMLKDKFSKGNIKVNLNGVQGGVEAQTPAEPPVTSVTGNTIIGDDHELTAHNGGKIDQNAIDGNRVKVDSGNS